MFARATLLSVVMLLGVPFGATSALADPVGFDPSTAGEKDASIVFITNATPQINVLGIDGVGVAASTGSTSLSAPPPATSLLLSTPAPNGNGRRHLLTYEQSSRLYSSVGKEGVDAGVDAQ